MKSGVSNVILVYVGISKMILVMSDADYVFSEMPG